MNELKQEYSDFFQDHQWGKERELFYDKEQFEQLERNHQVFQPESPSKFSMGNKDKNQGDSAATEGTFGDSITSPRMPAMPTKISARREKPGMPP